MTQQFPVPQEAVEAGLLAAVGQDMTLWLAIESISTEEFTSHREIFVFMKSYLDQYGSLPSASQISTRFNWQPPIGDFAYWNQEMQRYIKARKILDVMTRGYNLVSNPDQALEMMLEELGRVRSDNTNHIQATDSDAMHRLEMFDARTEHIFNGQGILGLPTGMKLIDDTRVGWIPGSVVGVIARPGVGKTWWLMWEGSQTWKAGYKVLCIAPEMPANMLSLRIDTVLGALLGANLDYNRIMIGDPSIRAEYARVLNTLSQSNRWWTYDSLNGETISVNDVGSLIRLHRPDIVLIDGISLLKSSVRGAPWEQMKADMYDLKNKGTQYEVPILITHQAVNSARGRRQEVQSTGRGDDFLMPSLNDAAYGDAFSQACTDVISMVGDELNPYINWYSFRKHRERGFVRPLPNRMAFAIDFGHGKIIDLSELGHSPEQVNTEARRLLGVR